MKRNNISFIGAVLISMIGAKGFAYDAKVDGIYYHFSGTTAEVTCECPPYAGGSEGNRLTYFGNLIVPESVTFNGNTYTVTSIGDHAFWGCSDLLSVTIPNSVTTIGQEAFYNCTHLESITFGTGLLSIGNGVISNSGYDYHQPAKVIWLANTPPKGYEKASGKVNYTSNNLYTGLSNTNVYPFLSSLFMVNGVKFVPVSPSERTCDIIDCQYDELAENIVIGESVDNKGITMKIRKILPYAFFGNSHIKSVNVESYIGNIPQYSFSVCDGINSCTINNIGDIEEKAFYESAISSPATFIINNIGGINTSAFEGCRGITSAVISNHGDIGERAFYGCSTLDLATFVIDNQGLIGNSAFEGCKSLRNVELGQDISSIGNNAFSGCTYLEKIIIPDGVQNLGSSAFENCKSLTYTKIGNSIPVLNESTFGGCSALAKMEIGSGVKTIEGRFEYPYYYGCFYNCSSLEEIIIPNNVVIVKDFVFKGCKRLKSVVMEDITNISEDDSFVLNLPELYIDNNTPGNTINKGTDFFFVGEGDVLSFDYKMGGSDPDYGYLSIYLDGEEIVKENGDKTGYFSKKITKSGNFSILAKSYLSSLVGTHGYVNVRIYNIRIEKSEINLTLGSNGSSALFADCPLDNVYIGRNILYDQTSSKGYSPFYRNTSLQSVTINDKETEVSENEFYGCTKLKNVKIGNGVTKIGDWAFSGCSSLDFFSFGSSVESIGKEAFSDCTAMTKLISFAAVPPTCGNQALDDINKWNCTLSVPKGCATAYQNAEQWKEFFFVNDDALGIRTTMTDASAPSNIYDLNGYKKEELQRGINIIRYSDGTVKKFMQK